MHDGVGFIRSWPALPRVVVSGVISLAKVLSSERSVVCDSQVFLSVHTLPIARVDAEDRYVVDKIESVSGTSFPHFISMPSKSSDDLSCTGFYGVSCYLGFREEFQLDVCAYVSFFHWSIWT